MLLLDTLRAGTGCTDAAVQLVEKLRGSSVLDAAAMYMTERRGTGPVDADLLAGLIVAQRAGKLAGRAPMYYTGDHNNGVWRLGSINPTALHYDQARAAILRHGPHVVDVLARMLVAECGRGHNRLSYAAWHRVHTFAAGYREYRAERAGFTGYSNCWISERFEQYRDETTARATTEFDRGAAAFIAAGVTGTAVLSAGLAHPQPDGISAFLWGILAALPVTGGSSALVVARALELLERPTDPRSVVLYALDTYLQQYRPRLSSVARELVTVVLNDFVIGDGVAVGHGEYVPWRATPVSWANEDIAAARSYVLATLERCDSRTPDKSVSDILRTYNSHKDSADALMRYRWMPNLRARSVAARAAARPVPQQVTRQRPPAPTVDFPPGDAAPPVRPTFSGRVARRRTLPPSD